MSRLENALHNGKYPVRQLVVLPVLLGVVVDISSYDFGVFPDHLYYIMPFVHENMVCSKQ